MNWPHHSSISRANTPVHGCASHNPWVIYWCIQYSCWCLPLATTGWYLESPLVTTLRNWLLGKFSGQIIIGNCWRCTKAYNILPIVVVTTSWKLIELPFIIQFSTDIQLKDDWYVRPIPASHHAKPLPFIFKNLAAGPCICLRDDTSRISLQPWYYGPHRVLDRRDKTISLDAGGRIITVSIGHVKPAHIDAKVTDSFQPPPAIPLAPQPSGTDLSQLPLSSSSTNRHFVHDSVRKAFKRFQRFWSIYFVFLFVRAVFLLCWGGDFICHTSSPLQSLLMRVATESITLVNDFQ